MFGVVIPNRYEDVIKPLVGSIRRHTREPMPEIVVVADNHERDYGFSRVAYDSPSFAFSVAANLGIRKLGGRDVILLNDDCEIIEPAFFSKLAYLAQIEPDVGILSPLILGCVGNAKQRWHEQDRWWDGQPDFQDVTGDEYLCFPCVYLKRSMLDDVGLLDENIRRYGYDDQDLCFRARKKGWRTTVTRLAAVQHGDGSDLLDDGYGRSWSVSFARRNGHRPRPTTRPIRARRRHF